jgi:Skp family chaperone for outer membrane proteins
MKLISTTLFLGLAALTVVGCNKQDRAELKTSAENAYADTKEAVANGWDKVKSYTFEKRNDFTAHAKALSADMDAKASKLRADFSETQASASRKAAMDELKNAEADYRQKLAALATASADTWDAAKNNVIAAWDRLQAAYYKARAD